MTHTLTVEPRPETGKGEARKLRKAGKAPGVLYSRGTEATPVAFDPETLVEIFRKTRNRNTVVELQLDGAAVPAIVKDAQRHPVSRDILHVDFYKVTDDHPVEIMVPVNMVGKPAGAAMGGRVRRIRRTVKARCTYDNIPAAFDVDVSHLDIGDMMKASELPMPEGVELVFDNDYNVIACYGKGR